MRKVGCCIWFLGRGSALRRTKEGTGLHCLNHMNKACANGYGDLGWN